VNVSWDILLPTTPHRHDMMCALLAELDRQWQPGLGMLAMRDNLERPGNESYAKWQELTELSRAEYISFIGDDDWVAPDFVARIMGALETRPDYVGFPVRHTLEGQLQVPVEHSLRHGGWQNTGNVIFRDIVHHNPIRRELALLARWRTDDQHADAYWADELRATGKVKQEAWISDPMYHYRETAGCWSRQGGPPPPMPESEILPMPVYPWLTSAGR